MQYISSMFSKHYINPPPIDTITNINSLFKDLYHFKDALNIY